MIKSLLFVTFINLSVSAQQRYYKIIHNKDTVIVDWQGVKDYIGDEIDKTTHDEPKETEPKDFIIIPIYLKPEEFEKVDYYRC